MERGEGAACWRFHPEAQKRPPHPEPRSCCKAQGSGLSLRGSAQAPGKAHERRGAVTQPLSSPRRHGNATPKAPAGKSWWGWERNRFQPQPQDVGPAA